ncbi:MAG: hypothetical protein WBQ14_03375 [Gaiellaceae bacterium]
MRLSVICAARLLDSSGSRRLRALRLRGFGVLALEIARGER